MNDDKLTNYRKGMIHGAIIMFIAGLFVIFLG